ncbi:MAG: hypothetical protein QOJ79_3389, partial [Actinomycetota bacterium]|nr:hypothetical protein [Actinomycetota bacterium]
VELVEDGEVTPGASGLHEVALRRDPS